MLYVSPVFPIIWPLSPWATPLSASFSTVIFIPGPGWDARSAGFCSCLNSSNQFRPKTHPGEVSYCVIYCFHWSSKCWVKTKARTPCGSRAIETASSITTGESACFSSPLCTGLESGPKDGNSLFDGLPASAIRPGLLEIRFYLPCLFIYVLFCFVLQCSGGPCICLVWVSCLCLLLIWAEHSLKSRLHPSVISGSDMVSRRSSFTTRMLNIPALSSFA